VPTVINSGYAVIFTPTDGNNYKDTTAVVTLTVNKADYIMAGVTFTGASFTYDGQPHSIVISGTLPTGVTVMYSVDGAAPVATYGVTEVDEYEITAVFATTDANYNAPATMTATLVINNKISYDMDGVTFEGASITYDGNAHSIYISGTLPDGVTVTYTGNGETAVGEYPVTAIFAVANPETHNIPAPMTATLTITKASYNMAGVTFTGASFTYDGQPHSIVISGTLPTGVSVMYSVDGAAPVATYGVTEVDEYEITAIFAVADPANYNVPESKTATLVINNKISYDMDGVTFEGASITYDGNAHSIYISGDLPDGVSVMYSVNGQPAVATYGVTEVDTYVITAIFTVANPETHNTPASMTATLTITPPIGIHNISQTGALIAWTQNGKLHVSGLIAGEKWNVYTLAGTLIYNSIATSDKAEISLQTRGAYIIKTEDKIVKVIFK
jgi:hypothetical protein